MADGKKKSKTRGRKKRGDGQAEKVGESEVPGAQPKGVTKTAKVDSDGAPAAPESVVEKPVGTKRPPSRVEPGARGTLTEMVPVRFDPQTLAAVRKRAADDHRSVSSWIRHAVDQELQYKR